MSIQEKIKQLEAEKAELLKRINEKKKALMAKAATQERKNDTRRKILIGSMILAEIAAGRYTEEKLASLATKHLTRSGDRALFGLEPLNETQKHEKTA
jgi:hypothetical protein